MNPKLHASMIWFKGKSLLLPYKICVGRLKHLRKRKFPPALATLLLVVITLFTMPSVCVAPLRLTTAIKAVSSSSSQLISLERQVLQVFERFHMSVDVGLVHEMAQIGVANQVDPRLIAAVVVAESSGDPLAVSHRNSIGLMQINAKVWARKLDFTHNNPFDPSTNLRMGVPILRACIREYHGLDSALAAYVGDVDSSKEETVAYVNRVIRIFEKAASTKVPRTLANHVSAGREALPSEGLEAVASNLPTP
jgi:hypothetical protein